jgi:hypothetical protein
MNSTSLGLTGFGFWLAVAVVAVAVVWAVVRKQQMKHELTLKVLEKGQSVDAALLAKLVATNNPGYPAQQKTGAELHREQGGFTGFIFILAGLIFAFIGMLRGPGGSWPLLVLGAFTFLFGWWTWHVTHKEYLREKAEEKLSRD